MNYIFRFIFLCLLITCALFSILLYTNKKNEMNSFSAYYNSNGGFAGFIQKKNNLLRACEFSSNGSILSCSKWFDAEKLKQGQNKGISLKDI